MILKQALAHQNQYLYQAAQYLYLFPVVLNQNPNLNPFQVAQYPLQNLSQVVLDQNQSLNPFQAVQDLNQNPVVLFQNPNPVVLDLNQNPVVQSLSQFQAALDQYQNPNQVAQYLLSLIHI